MRLDGLSIAELIKISQNIKGGRRKVLLKDINKYFYHRIEDEKWCSEEEICDLEDFVSEISGEFWDTTDTVEFRKVLKRINELIIGSKKEIEKRNNTEFKKLKKEALEIKDHDHILILLKEILKELEKDRVSCERLTNKIKRIDKEINIYISDSLFDLLKRVIDWIDRHEEDIFDGKIFKKRKEFQNYITSLNKRLEKFENNDIRFKKLLESGEIVLESEDSFNEKNIYFSDDRLETVNQRVITIDSQQALSLEGAFSVKKDRGFYLFDVYVTDVPTFLKDNRAIAKKAYERGTSISIGNCKGTKDTHIDILPSMLDDHYLSLRQDKMRNVIDFSFIVKDDGEIESVFVSRKRLNVTDRLDYNRAKELFFSKNTNSKVRWELLTYREMVGKIIEKVDAPYLKEISVDRINDLVSFASILVNYYVGHEADFAIYRDNGCYVKSKDNNCYTHSVTPLRRFVSNINLAFLLNQKGEVSFDEKDLVYVEKNIDEIIAHLNRQDDFSEFVNRNPDMAKRYVKIR